MIGVAELCLAREFVVAVTIRDVIPRCSNLFATT